MKNTLRVVQKDALPGDKAIAYCGDREEIEANAALIAAAPELLSSLEALVEELDTWHDVGPKEFSQALAAIDKAVGH